MSRTNIMHPIDGLLAVGFLGLDELRKEANEKLGKLDKAMEKVGELGTKIETLTAAVRDLTAEFRRRP